MLPNDFISLGSIDLLMIYGIFALEKKILNEGSAIEEVFTISIVSEDGTAIIAQVNFADEENARKLFKTLDDAGFYR